MVFIGILAKAFSLLQLVLRGGEFGNEGNITLKSWSHPRETLSQLSQLTWVHQHCTALNSFDPFVAVKCGDSEIAVNKAYPRYLSSK